MQAGRRWYLLCWDLDRADWRTFRVDRMGTISPSTIGFEPRQLPHPAVEMVSQAISTRPYRYQVRIRILAGADTVRQRIPPTAGLVLDAGADRCELVSGSDSLLAIAVHTAELDLDFEVIEPVELRAVVARLARRLTRGPT